MSVQTHAIPTNFSDAGDLISRRAHGLSPVVRRRRFSALFGATPTACARGRNTIYSALPKSCEPKQFM